MALTATACMHMSQPSLYERLGGAVLGPMKSDIVGR